MESVFNDVVLTNKTLRLTDIHFADIYQECIDGVVSGEIKVNDKDDYIEHNENKKKMCLSGGCRSSFTYLQAAYWIQTGECIALLP